MVKETTPIIAFFEAYNKAEKELLEKILKQVLQRNVTDKDFVYLSATIIDAENYNLHFAGKHIGDVHKAFNDFEPAYEFVPLNKYL